MNDGIDKDDLFSADADEFGGFEADFGDDAPVMAETEAQEPEEEMTDPLTPANDEAPVEAPVASEGQTIQEGSVEISAGTVTGEENASETVTESPGTVTGTTEPVEPVTESATSVTDAAAPAMPPMKKIRKPLTKRQKMVRVILRRAGVEELPALDILMRDKEGISVAIKDIALFIGQPEDEILADLAQDLPVKNTVNLSAEVEKNRVISVGADIIRAGRMFQPIQLADIVEWDVPTGNWQCTSGRHRLAFLALAYGVEASIPVYIENMTLNEARDAVVVANQARPTRARERAEHAVLSAVSGNADALQKELYEATATTKANARKYCVYSVFDKGHPIKLAFPVSQTSSRKDGGLTTVSNVENYWNAALSWEKGTTWKKYDVALKGSIQFLNAFVAAMDGNPEFDPNHHLASMTLSAVGKWYRAYQEITGKDATPLAEKVAGIIVSLGEIGRQKSELTYDALTIEMRG